MGEVYEVKIPLCPKCGGDMLESFQLDDATDRSIRQKLGDRLGDADMPYPYHICQKCSVVVVDGDEQETRAEYCQMLSHIDADGSELVEIRKGATADLAGAPANWYEWTATGPVSTANYTGVDNAFGELMADIEL